MVPRVEIRGKEPQDQDPIGQTLGLERCRCRACNDAEVGTPSTKIVSTSLIAFLK